MLQSKSYPKMCKLFRLRIYKPSGAWSWGKNTEPVCPSVALSCAYSPTTCAPYCAPLLPVRKNSWKSGPTSEVLGVTPSRALGYGHAHFVSLLVTMKLLSLPGSEVERILQRGQACTTSRPVAMTAGHLLGPLKDVASEWLAPAQCSLQQSSLSTGTDGWLSA